MCFVVTFCNLNVKLSNIVPKLCDFPKCVEAELFHSCFLFLAGKVIRLEMNCDETVIKKSAYVFPLCIMYKERTCNLHLE